MLTIYTCLVEEHDWRLVAVAVAICALGCVVSAALWDKLDRKKHRRWALWVGLAALTAAASVWATHFVAMLAHEVSLERGLSLPLTALSFASAVLLMFPASIALGRARQRPGWGVPAGAAFAIAVAVMHYTGMAAYRTGAWMAWDMRFVALSIASGGVFAVLGAVLFASPRAWLSRLVAPLLLAVSIAALHFIGMSAVTITPFADPLDGQAGPGDDWLAAATIAAVAVVLVGAAAALWQDRAELRWNARRLRQQRDRAEAATRAKSRFLANMSHELRTPLNGVLGLTQALRNTPLRDDQRELVDTIIASGDALIAIVDDILDAARIDAKRIVIDPAPFDLRTLVDDVVRLMSGQAQAKGLRLEAAISPDLSARVIGDAARVRQILLNLVGNAIKFTETGSVRIDAGPDSDDGAVILAVTDTGIGIAPDRQAEIFAAFAQADESTTRRFGGTGLGLTICRELAQLMGGEIDVESRPGSGATFRARLHLPRAEDAPTPAESAAPTVPETPARADAEAAGAGERAGPPPRLTRVLVVDDMRLNRIVVSKILPPDTFETIEAENGRLACEAVAKARAENRPFDAVLMDVSMPVMDGLAATAIIREAEAESGASPLRIIGLTAHTAPEHQDRCRAAGMDDVLVKPVRRASLLDALSGLIAKRAA